MIDRIGQQLAEALLEGWAIIWGAELTTGLGSGT